MAVYFIQAGENGPVKIGYSENVHTRLVKMRADNHEKLTCIGLMDGDKKDEAKFHRRFASHRIRGEWFNPAGNILSLARKHPPPPPPRRRPLPRPKDLYVWLDNADTGVGFKAPCEPGVNYLDHPSVPKPRASFLAAAYKKIADEDPDDWPQWWTDFLNDAITPNDFIEAAW